jgi:pimeloyl-ACP methyl ester carboxylesterase
MTAFAKAAEIDCFLTTPRARLRALRFGKESDRPVICVPGITSNSRAFAFFGERLAGAGLQLIALDLRGRGFSDKTGLCTYGWKNHARDVFGAADALGIDEFDIIGHSMGAWVGMQAVSMDKQSRIRRLVLVDGLGLPSASAARVIARNAKRLRHVYPTADDYVQAVQRLGLISPWNEYWERHYRYELVDAAGCVRTRTKRLAAYEDIAYPATHSPRALWRSIACPVLVVRAARPLADPNWFVITARDLARFTKLKPSSIVEEIDANHYGIVTHEDSVAVIRSFLCRNY